MPNTQPDKVVIASVAAGGALSFSPRSYARIKGANDRLRVAVMGLNGRGKAHLINPNFVAGQTVTIRVFSASYDAQTSTLLALPAWRINAHEPAATVRADIKRHNDHRM